jgi:plastocyanin
MRKSSSRSVPAVVAVLAALTLLGAACTNDDATVGEQTDTGATTTAPAETTTPAPPETSDIGSTGVTVTATNFAFTPPNPTVAAGETITFTDAHPSTPHSFTVDGTDIDEVASAGAPVDIVIDLDPGEYDFFCRFHSQMQGTLTVT